MIRIFIRIANGRMSVLPIADDQAAPPVGAQFVGAVANEEDYKDFLAEVGHQANAVSLGAVNCNQGYSDKELLDWADRQRRLYKKGKLSKTRIKKLESISGWTWDSPDKHRQSI